MLNSNAFKVPQCLRVTATPKLPMTPNSDLSLYTPSSFKRCPNIFPAPLDLNHPLSALSPPINTTQHLLQPPQHLLIATLTLFTHQADQLSAQRLLISVAKVFLDALAQGVDASPDLLGVVGGQEFLCHGARV